VPRGGPRPNSGRPKGAKTKLTEQAILKAGEGLLPLDYMLSLLRDESLDTAQRFEAAKAAAPYVHARLSQVDSTVTHKRDVAELTTAELDELLAAELASGKARTSGGHRDAGGVH